MENLPFSDSARSQTQGNILQAIAQVYPDFIKDRLCGHESINTTWVQFIRQTIWGRTGYFFQIEKDVYTKLQPIFESVYQGFSRDEHYPQIYNEQYDNGWPMAWLDEERLTVWVQVPTPTSEQS
jgi:hypothetical protein